MIGLTAIGILIIVLIVPIGDTMREQVLGLIGILLSAAIALSSTTVLGNAMAGVMLKVVRGFRMGDFIRAGEHFGRVSERGRFHKEIQTEDRQLTTLPNLYLVTHPVTTVRSSGTFVTATISLGYDVPRAKLEELLCRAAERAELTDPFVYVLELGDFSVTYRIAGFLSEVKQLLSARSRLRKCVMDVLHDGRIEIVSPNFMNTRAVPTEKIFIPEAIVTTSVKPEDLPEDRLFDKAEEAESLDNLRAIYRKLSEEVEALEEQVKEEQEGPARDAGQSNLAALRSRMERLGMVVVDRESQAKQEK